MEICIRNLSIHYSSRPTVAFICCDARARSMPLVLNYQVNSNVTCNKANSHKTNRNRANQQITLHTTIITIISSTTINNTITIHTTRPRGSCIDGRDYAYLEIAFNTIVIMIEQRLMQNIFNKFVYEPNMLYILSLYVVCRTRIIPNGGWMRHR